MLVDLKNRVQFLKYRFNDKNLCLIFEQLDEKYGIFLNNWLDDHSAVLLSFMETSHSPV